MKRENWSFGVLESWSDEGTPRRQRSISQPLRHSIAQIFALFLLAVVAPLEAPAQENGSAGRPDFQSFRIIAERNIFNPNRSARRERPQAERGPERRVQTDSLALLGTMNYEKGWLAFFDGSRPDYRKALQPGDAIAGYTVAEIAPNHVKLESAGNGTIELRVGTQMKKQDEGPWEVSDWLEPPAATTAATSSETNSSSSDSAESDIIKRLMQQREQELQK